MGKGGTLALSVTIGTALDDQNTSLVSGTVSIRKPLGRPATASMDILSVQSGAATTTPGSSTTTEYRIELGANDFLEIDTSGSYLYWRPATTSSTPGTVTGGHPPVSPGDSVTISIDGVQQFRGIVKRVLESAQERVFYKRYRIQAVDISIYLSDRVLTADVTPDADNAFTLWNGITSILDAVSTTGTGLYNASYATNSVPAGFTLPQGTPAIEALNTMCAQVGEAWRVKADGGITTTASADQSTSTWTASGSTLMGVHKETHDGDLYNEVHLTWSNAGVDTEVKVNDATSIAEYGSRTMRVRDDSVTTAYAAGVAAQSILDRHKNPQVLLRGQIHPPQFASSWPEPGDLCSVSLINGFGIDGETWLVDEVDLAQEPQGTGKSLYRATVTLSKNAHKDGWFSLWRRVETAAGV